MNQKVLLFICSFCWTVLFIGCWEITDWVFETEWIFEKNWHHDIVIMGWFLFGGASVQFYAWLDKKKKQLNCSKRK